MTSSNRFGYEIPRGPLAVTLIRHGQAPWIREGVTIDEPALGPMGVDQSTALAAELQHRAFDAVAVSPLKRARQTAAIACKTLPAPTVEDWLAEVRYPSWQGLPADVAAKALAGVRTLPASRRWEGFQESGENIRSFLSRVRTGLLAFLSNIEISNLVEDGATLWSVPNATCELLFVAHAGSISAVISTLLGLPSVPWDWERFQVSHCSLTRLVTIPVGKNYTFSIEQLGYMEYIPHKLRSW